MFVPYPDNSGQVFVLAREKLAGFPAPRLPAMTQDNRYEQNVQQMMWQTYFLAVNTMQVWLKR